MFASTNRFVGFGAIRCFAAVAFAAACFFATSAAWSDIVRVEEDWELVIGDPTPNSDAPQVTCVISPLGSVDNLHTTFVVNHHEAPEFVAGGLQLQAWTGECLLESKRAPNQAVLATPGETVRWTQVMRKAEEGMVFEITHGTSTTWGNFGDDGTMKITLTGTPATLSGYDPANSVKNSGVSFAGNRVTSLVLKRVRTYNEAGVVTEDATPRVVHSIAQ